MQICCHKYILFPRIRCQGLSSAPRLEHYRCIRLLALRKPKMTTCLWVHSGHTVSLLKSLKLLVTATLTCILQYITTKLWLQCSSWKLNSSEWCILCWQSLSMDLINLGSPIFCRYFNLDHCYITFFERKGFTSITALCQIKHIQTLLHLLLWEEGFYFHHCPVSNQTHSTTVTLPSLRRRVLLLSLLCVK